MKAKGRDGLPLAAIAWVLWVLFAASAQAQEVPRITSAELAAKLGSADLLLLDVRAEADWKASDKKIQGALREDPRSVDNWASKYPKDKTVVLYCA